MAAALAQAGAQVTLAARTQRRDRGRCGGHRCGRRPGDAAVLDVSDTAAVAAFFASRPAFHVLVNNAGTNRPKPLWEVSEDDYDAVLDLNLRPRSSWRKARSRPCWPKVLPGAA
jgi:NAD(P)-dependent dehydrogenase (short-subunit alcohol dehydrogenase family)